MTKREVMQMALDSLETLYMDDDDVSDYEWMKCRDAIAALSAELEKPDPEPGTDEHD